MSRGATGRQPAFLLGAGDATLRARLLGDTLLRMRTEAGLVQLEAARGVQRSPATLSRWELGELIPSPADLLYLLTQIYGVGEAAAKEVMRLAEEATEPEVESVPQKVADYDWLESQATGIEDFQEAVVPLLLQTEAYAREIVKAWDPATTKEQVARVVRMRAARQQQRLTEERPVELSAVVSEGALLRTIGGPEVMRAQLRHLLGRAALPTVELRLLTNDAGAHAGLAGSFTILRFRGASGGASDRAIVFTYSRGGDVYFEDVVPFEQAFRRIRGQCALAPGLGRYDRGHVQGDDGVNWRASSLSGAGSDCVESAALPAGAGVAIRDSKDPGGGTLTCPPDAWRAFVEAVRGEPATFTSPA